MKITPRKTRRIKVLGITRTSAAPVEPTGGGVSDGDKGDITVSGAGSTWSINSASHTHPQSEITSLVTDLAGKAASVHTHAISDVTGLQTALDGKQAAGSYAAASHNHAASEITSGTVGTARLGTGTADSTTFLRGDQTWAAPTGGTGDVVGDDTSTTNQNIVAYNGTGGKNITELTGTQGDILYHNGTSWVKLGAGTAGQFLKTSGASANPVWQPPKVWNYSSASQGPGFSSDTYVTGSSIAIPNGRLTAGSRYRCVFRAEKTNAGTQTPRLNVRFGTNGTTADTSRATLTWTAGTAAADDSIWEIWCTFTAIGALGVLRTMGRITHKLSVTGFTGTGAVSESEVAVSGTFDTTVSNSIIGVSVNGGTSASWTIYMVQAELENLI